MASFSDLYCFSKRQCHASHAGSLLQYQCKVLQSIAKYCNVIQFYAYAIPCNITEYQAIPPLQRYFCSLLDFCLLHPFFPVSIHSSSLVNRVHRQRRSLWVPAQSHHKTDKGRPARILQICSISSDLGMAPPDLFNQSQMDLKLSFQQRERQM